MIFNSGFQDWVDVGNLLDFSCFVDPALCTEGFTLSFWLKVKPGATLSTILTTMGDPMTDQGIQISCADVPAMGYVLL